MCTIVIEALTPFNRILGIKMYKNIARSRLFCRIAKSSIADLLSFDFTTGQKLEGEWIFARRLSTEVVLASCMHYYTATTSVFFLLTCF